MQLTCVEVALPESVSHLAHVRDAVTAFLMPLTLDAAVRQGCADIVRRFRAKSCSVAAMEAAVENGHYDVIKGLITYGKAAPDSVIAHHVMRRVAQEGNSQAALLLAPVCGGTSVIRAFTYAHHKGNWDWVQKLYEGGHRQSSPDGLLVGAARAGREDIVQLVVEDCNPYHILTAMEAAVEAAQWGVVRALHKYRCIGPKQFGIALTSAIAAAKWEMVELLLPLCEEKSVKEAMKPAVLQRRWDVVKLLCEKLQMQEYEQGLALADKEPAV